MKAWGKDDLRAREILREWRRRGVEFVKLVVAPSADATNWECWPVGSDKAAFNGSAVYPMPNMAELPELESETTPGGPISDIELFMAAAISESWDDPTVPTLISKFHSSG
jgi:hypothetical protein